MTTRLQSWGNSQGIRLPKSLLKALDVETGSNLELELSPKKDAIMVKPVRAGNPVRGRHRIEDLAAAMPKDYKTAEFEWGESGREVW
tara:strand:+ start:144 stop:404 length:261 start_codon:yes stop_codon:yes gene_type:complete